MANQNCEVRPYTLNADRAVKKKLGIPFLSVGLEEKNKGQCLVAQLDLSFFQAVYSAFTSYYRENGRVSDVVDVAGALVETKITVEQPRRKVKLTLYNTKNKVMLQGSRTAVVWWQSTQLPVILETVSLSPKMKMPPPSLPGVSDAVSAPDSGVHSVGSSSGESAPDSSTNPVCISGVSSADAATCVPVTSDVIPGSAERVTGPCVQVPTVVNSGATSSTATDADHRSLPVSPGTRSSVSIGCCDNRPVLDRLDKLESSIADLMGILSAEKVNLVREVSGKEIELLHTKHRGVVDGLRNELSCKDTELRRLKEELSEMKKSMKKKEEGAADASRKITSLKCEVQQLRGVLEEKNNDIDALRSREVNLMSKRNGNSVKCSGEVAEERRKTGDHNAVPGTVAEMWRKNVESEKSCDVIAGGVTDVRAKRSGDGWQTVPQSKFKEPDVLLVGNSNVRGLDSRLLNPLFVRKHVLSEKTLRGAAEFLKSTDVSPRQYVIVQAIDNDIGEISPKMIIERIEELVGICRSRFPGVELYVVEPLGRYLVDGPQIYWRNAVRVCEMLASVVGINVVSIPGKLRTADAVLFVRERGCYIHLNSDGVGALSRVYRSCFLGGRRDGDSREGVARGKGVHVEGSVDVDSGRGRRFGRAENRQVGSDSVKGRGADKGEADKDVGDRFGLLVHTLIEGLSRFT